MSLSPSPPTIDTKRAKKHDVEESPHAIKAGQHKYITNIKIIYDKDSADWRQEKATCPLSIPHSCPKVKRTNFPKHFWQHVMRDEHKNPEYPVVLKVGTKLTVGSYGVICSKNCKDIDGKIVCPTSEEAWARHLKECPGGGPTKVPAQKKFPKWVDGLQTQEDAIAWFARKDAQKKAAKKKKNKK